MTQEDKQLLLKDLCARLPYGVMYETEYGPRIINDLFIYSNGPVYTDHIIGDYNQIYGTELEHIKPYLRPMSSMTEEELKENWTFMEKDGRGFPTDLVSVSQFSDGKFTEYLDWLLSHHFDFRGLIEKGLALEAPEDMYKTE